MLMSNTINGKEARFIRKQLGMGQLEFWQAIGVTQSAGSRYESGQNMSAQIAELVRIRYVEKLPLARVKAEYIHIALALKERDSELYQSLKSVVQKQLPM